MPVEIGSKEWLQPRAFLGSTWNEINGVCDAVTGACSGELNGHNLEGWIWAGLDDVNGLYNDYFSTAQTPSGPQWLGMGPGPDAYTVSTAYWARLWNRGPFTTTGSIYNTMIFSYLYEMWEGWLRDTDATNSAGRVASIGIQSTYVGGESIISTEGTADKDNNYYSLAYDPGSQTVTVFQLGGFFFRETATVPAPSTALLVILGGFAMRQRSHRSKLFKK
ncbi:MAG: hypothetical protein AB8B48_10370 [Pseudomonadales bacterium]